MKGSKLEWILIPSIIYKYLNQFKDEKAYYGPFFGKGIYMYILSNNSGYQIYQIGQSSSEIGNRLFDHYHGFMHEKNEYSVPHNIELAKENIYDKKIEWKKKSESEEERKKIGNYLVDNSYIAIAVNNSLTEETIRDIEAICQHAVKIKNNLNSDELKMIGCQRIHLSDMSDYYLQSYFVNNEVKKIISQTMQEIIQFSKGKIEIQF